MKMTRLGKVFTAVLLIVFALGWLSSSSFLSGLATAGVVALVAVEGRWAIQAMRQSIWRLRNRLMVTYLFIAVVPIVLILALAAVGTWIVAGQMAIYLV